MAHLNNDKTVMFFISTERTFHSRCSATEKALSQNFVLVRGIAPYGILLTNGVNTGIYIDNLKWNQICVQNWYICAFIYNLAHKPLSCWSKYKRDNVRIKIQIKCTRQDQWQGPCEIMLSRRSGHPRINKNYYNQFLKTLKLNRYTNLAKIDMIIIQWAFTYNRL